MTKTIVTQLTLLFSLGLFAFSSASSIPLNAQEAPYKYSFAVINAPKGLNVRDSNCNRLTTYPNKTIVQRFVVNYNATPAGSPVKIQCTVKGTLYNMEFISDAGGSEDQISGYVASDFLVTPQHATKVNLVATKVNAQAGLNVRDGNCNKVGAVPNNYQFPSVEGFGGGLVICEVNGTYYEMLAVSYNGNFRYVASVFTV
jgi:hypothetical protein